MTVTVDTQALEAKVKDMYRHVAQQPHDRFHFELGAPVALRVGYDADRLADLPTGAVESFAGVGFFFDLADLQAGETVVDLGSGSGMDAFSQPVWSAPQGTCTGSTSPRSSWTRHAGSPTSPDSPRSSSGRAASRRSRWQMAPWTA